MILETLFSYFDTISFDMNGSPNRIRKADILLIFLQFTMPTAIPPWVNQFSSDHWSQAESGHVSTWMGDCLETHAVVGFIFQFSRLSLFVDKWLSVSIKKLTTILSQELRNSNYCNTRPGIADFVLELMVVCRRLYDLGDFVSIFRFNLIRYDWSPIRIRKADILLIFSQFTMPTAIPPWVYQFSSDHWSQAGSGHVSTWMGDCLGTHGAVGFIF